MMTRSASFFFLTCLLFNGLSVHAGPLERLPNESLALPDELPEGTFKTENIFPDLRFTRPVAIVTPPGETTRLFVLEQTGRIIVIPDLASPSKETFLDLTSKTAYQGESGLLGLAFHPDYAENGFFYVFYSTSINRIRYQRVARFEVSPDNPNRALINSEVPMIDQRDEASNHNGGDLHFGPDQYLYISVGDEGGANDNYNNSRFIDRDFFSGILRIDVDQRPDSLAPISHPAVYEGTYTIPPDNPFVGVDSFMGERVDPDSVRTEFWAVGLRNPWRMAFDGPTGRLFTGDVGQGAREEIDLIERGGHYGWSFREGERSFNSGPGGSRAPSDFAPLEPVYDYGRGDGISVTGGVVYRGQDHPELFESYVFGDYGSGNIWSMEFLDDGEVDVKEIASERSVSAFGVDPRNGDVLLAAYSLGQIKKIARKSRPFSLLIPAKLSRTRAFEDLVSLTPNEGIVAYEPNVSFWSDGALKQRWFSIPEMEDMAEFRENEPWTFPAGTTWIKHFEMEMTAGDPSSRRRLETRFLVKTEGSSYGLTYRWNEDQTDADLVDAEGERETLEIQMADGVREQEWIYPSRNDCRACHTREAGHALSFNTAQLNRVFSYEAGPANQLEALKEAGYFQEELPEAASLPVLATADDRSRSLEDRVRSYLDVNCAQCHQPGGPALGFWDARAHVPLEESGIINGDLVGHYGDPNNRVIVPGSESQSMLLMRLLGNTEAPRMPPLGSTRVDEGAVTLIQEWIQALAEDQEVTYQDWTQQFLDSMAAEDLLESSDPDRDGRTNLEEFLADTHPGRANDFWQPRVELLEDGKITLTYPEPSRGQVTTEWSLDAEEWSLWEATPEQVTILENEGHVRIRLERHESGKSFFRTKLIETP